MATFRLAMLLGKTVDELDISYQEFIYWQAYLALEPPERGDNYRTAMLLSQITNMAGRSLPGSKQVKPEDFIGRSKSERQAMQDQINFMKSLGKK